MSDWFDRHRERLERAVEACRTREYWSPFPESPSRKLHPEGAKDEGLKRFESRLGARFELGLPHTPGFVGAEVSPYTREPLGIEYEAVDVDALYAAKYAAWPAWRDASVEARVGVCMEMLERWRNAVFENAWATMHTAGQGFVMAFAGSGANSLDRGLEGLTYAYKAMRDVPESATFTRSFGREPVTLDKRYRLVPRGVAVVIACASYPAWNAYPAVLANLATGNPVVVKPHPTGVLPLAIAVEIGRDCLREAGFDPNVLTLAVDTPETPITKRLVQRDDTAIVDFTGSARFGAWLEDNCRHALVYTETAGCNAVVLDSARDLDAALRAVAHSVCSFSSQMCTAAQNLYVPRAGVRDGDRTVPQGEVIERLVAQMDALLEDPAHAAGLCGAIQSERTLADIEAFAEQGEVVRASAPYEHPEFPNARTATPVLVRVNASEREAVRREHFGPMAFVIDVANRDEALALASTDARECGAIASYAYSTDDAFLAHAQDTYARAGASLGCNLVRQLPINYAAAYSDFHVTGLNPAGNASLTDLAFVAQRFRVVETKTERAPEAG